MKMPTQINGLRDMCARYDILICDIWGVLHNGKTPFKGSDDALIQFRKEGGNVLLLSNAPRPSDSVYARLHDIGIKEGICDAIITSGDLARTMAEDYAKDGKIGHHIGPDKDAPVVDNINAPFVAEMRDADYILLSGLYDDTTETPDDYQDLLAQARALNLPMLCANPDRQVQYGAQIIYCAGAIAERYAQSGGEVVWIGKPYKAIYDHIHKTIKTLGLRGTRLLAIGDGAKTDMIGAADAHIDALFISGGLADLSPDESGAFLAQENTHAAWVARHLVW